MPKILLPFLFLLFIHTNDELPDSKLAADARNTLWPKLSKELNAKGLTPGAPIFVRIFKNESILEIWVKGDKEYKLFKTYPICYYSGGLGTKTRRNDGKSPEGFYTIEPKQLNPYSQYHLAINVGYPNAFEKQQGYTGSDIMIHGNCASIGCYAMTDPLIEEIYTMVYKALEGGQKSIPLHIFPFRLRSEYLNALTESAYFDLWMSMKKGYDLFETNHIPPVVSVMNEQYVFKRE